MRMCCCLTCTDHAPKTMCQAVEHNLGQGLHVWPSSLTTAAQPTAKQLKPRLSSLLACTKSCSFLCTDALHHADMHPGGARLQVDLIAVQAPP